MQYTYVYSIKIHIILLLCIIGSYIINGTLFPHAAVPPSSTIVFIVYNNIIILSMDGKQYLRHYFILRHAGREGVADINNKIIIVLCVCNSLTFLVVS